MNGMRREDWVYWWGAGQRINYVIGGGVLW
jgi:hypothetical protein